nr:MAG TPA: hypothetical protein [Caudoviricetes sp.]
MEKNLLKCLTLIERSEIILRTNERTNEKKIAWKGGQWFSYYCYSLKGDFNE